MSVTQCDQTISLTGHYTAQDYPDPLRRVRYFDTQINKRLVFLTNQFDLPAQTIAQLYKSRWQVELFFKWIKQHLRIKAFEKTPILRACLTMPEQKQTDQNPNQLMLFEL